MCSRKCEMPLFSSVSKRDPTRFSSVTTARCAVGCGTHKTTRPFESVCRWCETPQLKVASVARGDASLSLAKARCACDEPRPVKDRDLLFLAFGPFFFV